MGDLHGDPRSLSAPMFVLFWGGGLSPLRCLFSKNLPLGGLYGDSRFFSTPPLVLFWAGSPFFLRFQCGAVLYFCCMARGARFWLCFLLCLGV